jgi:hypothetical protein
MRRQIPVVLLTSAVALGGGIALAPAASADDNDRAVGSCSGPSRWVADLEKDDGEIEVDFTVKTGSAGQRWTYTLTHNGDVVVTSTRTTRSDDDDDDDDDSPSRRHVAEVEWDRDRPDRPGTDAFVLRAINPASGEVCTFTGRL